MLKVPPKTVAQAIAPLKQVETNLRAVAKAQAAAAKEKRDQISRLTTQAEACDKECAGADKLAAKLAELLS